MKSKLQRIIFIFALFTFLFIAKDECYAREAFTSYSINYWGEAVEQPYPYIYEKTLSESNFGEKLNFPKDMFYHEGLLYIADTGNSRVLVMDTNGKILRKITFANGSDDKLREPSGIYVTNEGHLYIADSGNGRIIELDENDKFVREIGRPKTNLISESQEYKPLKVVVDKTGRIYAIAYGINMGLVEFDRDGNFQGFMGAAEVNVSKFTYIWKNYFSTEAQQARMDTIIPTEYSNIFVDKEGFIYATINNLTEEEHASGKEAVRRLNPTGTDVLRRLANYEIIGDVDWSDGAFSSFSDIAATDYGCYFILDDNNGKIFVYDYDGNSLFVFAKNGIKEGNFQKPVSLVIDEDADRVFVLDNIQGSVVSFKITDYGRCVLNAISLNNDGKTEESNACWREVLSKNSNCELAYIGLGKTYLTDGDYKKAMEYFKLGNSKKYYAKSFYYYRREVMEKGFSKCMWVLGSIIVLLLVIKGSKRFKGWVGEVKCFTAKH